MRVDIRHLCCMCSVQERRWTAPTLSRARRNYPQPLDKTLHGGWLQFTVVFEVTLSKFLTMGGDTIDTGCCWLLLTSKFLHCPCCCWQPCCWLAPMLLLASLHQDAAAWCRCCCLFLSCPCLKNLSVSRSRLFTFTMLEKPFDPRSETFYIPPCRKSLVPGEWHGLTPGNGRLFLPCINVTKTLRVAGKMILYQQKAFHPW